ncbi:MAG: hypothetical protein V4567_01960 [Pseudomonadota bacterium]
MDKYTRQFYTRNQVKIIIDAYQHIFGLIGNELRSYWDLDRKRDWGCLTTDFHKSTFEQYDEASRRAIKAEATISNPKELGFALREITKETGVGLSLGVCPWTDHGLLQTYEQNKHKGRLTIILGHDWYPIVPQPKKKPHPVDVPLCCDQGLHTCQKYIHRGAVPAAIESKQELLLFLNLNPDFRPPNTPVSGRFEPSTYQRCAKGFDALVEAVSRNFKEVQVISWGAPVWEALREQGDEDSKSLSVMAYAKERSGRFLKLRCGGKIVPYLPLAHPCYASNFNKANAHQGFLKMGLGGCSH